jgi:glucosamine--fructose-6-phosphate aminotransferase (isomerizing)
MLGQHMEREIREQPAVLRGANYAEAFRPLAGRQFDMVLLVARGSSDNAALFARYLIEVHLGIPVSLAAPSVLTRFGSRVRYRNCLGVGISQSGAAPDIAEVLEALRAEGHVTVGVTNTADSRLANTVDIPVLLDAGLEKALAATKTYTASLLAMIELVRALGADLPANVLPDDAWIARCEEEAVVASGAVLRSSPVFALGRGYGFATAHETALKLMECALVACKAYSTADFEHGPKALAGHGSAALSFEGPRPNLTEQGCEIVAAPDPEGVPAEFRPLWDAVFGQWTALHAARARGLDPDAARHLSKVTRTR